MSKPLAPPSERLPTYRMERPDLDAWMRRADAAIEGRGEYRGFVFYDESPPPISDRVWSRVWVSDREGTLTFSTTRSVEPFWLRIQYD